MTKRPKVARDVTELREQIAKWRHKEKSIALVPTMGALHAGHISLVKRAHKEADKTIVSIFVNPTQFAQGEDLARYPRDEEQDFERLAKQSVDLVWIPSVDTMYPKDFSTTIQPGSAARGLEGEIRPAHFAGVATVCAKLFNQTTPDCAIFGEKDYQQLVMLRQMVRDFDMPLKLVGAPIVRENDGLALSSRNVYLSKEHRRIAPELHNVITDVASSVAAGEDQTSTLASARIRLLVAGFDKVDYLDVRNAETLAPATTKDTVPQRVLAAARLATTRLIDNVAIPPR